MKYCSTNAGGGTGGATSASDERKPTFTVYANMNLSQTELNGGAQDSEMAPIRSQLELAQKALKQQTRRCQQLVCEYTRRLRLKEQQFQSEKALRDDQLARVIRALLIVEARLRQEQKFISQQLQEKDCIIQKQSDEIKKLLIGVQHCNNCSRFVNNDAAPPGSFDSSSEYMATDYHSSLDSGSDIYASLSEKSYNTDRSDAKSIYQKNKAAKSRKLQHFRKDKNAIGSYFEVLKLRNNSPCSNEDNASNDYGSLQIAATVSNGSTSPAADLNSSSNIGSTVETTDVKSDKIGDQDSKRMTVSDNIPVFEPDTEQPQERWYASASDPEDDEHRREYRNNPVLECMDQILKQDLLSEPPPSPERKLNKNITKKVKFSDQENLKPLTQSNVNQSTYYETPIQQTPNVYEIPQSIYSNDYEQIAGGSTISSNGHHYADMTPKLLDSTQTLPQWRTKIVRTTPPALPPKPPNLMTRYRPVRVKESDSEPDYCSISELNLPAPKICVIADINAPTSQEVLRKTDETSEVKCTSINIPKLPQVCELIIPEEDADCNKESTTPKKKMLQLPSPTCVRNATVQQQRDAAENPVVSTDNYIQFVKMRKSDSDSARHSVTIGESVSNILAHLTNNKSPSNRAAAPVEPTALEPTKKFDLSENFEEFKLDECDMGTDYDATEATAVNDSKTAVGSSPTPSRTDALIIETTPARNHVAAAPLSRDQVTYEHFLECTGLSSKSLLTPSRQLSNHKAMLKPKDVKYRAKVKTAATHIFERHLHANGCTTIKYWSEPYV